MQSIYNVQLLSWNDKNLNIQHFIFRLQKVAPFSSLKNVAVDGVCAKNQVLDIKCKNCSCKINNLIISKI